MQLTTQQTETTMSSIELKNIINSSRIAYGEPLIRLNKLNEKIVDELKGEYYPKSVVKNSNNTQSDVYHLTVEQCMLVGMRESKGVRRGVMEKLRELEVKQIDTPELQMAKGLIAAQQMIENANKQIAEMKPKVEYHDRVLATDNGITTTEIAAELGMSARKLNDILAQMKVQRKIGNRWVLTAANLNKGYDVEVTHVDDGGKSRHAMKWSEKGRKFIHELIEG